MRFAGASVMDLSAEPRGALLDCQLLAEVYLSCGGCRQASPMVQSRPETPVICATALPGPHQAPRNWPPILHAGRHQESSVAEAGAEDAGAAPKVTQTAG